MATILKGDDLEKELRGREPLTGSIKLRERDSESKDVYDDFQIEGVLHAGGSCICYRALRTFENSDMAETGTLKEFYPVDSQKNSKLSYNLKRYDIDTGDLAKQLYSGELTLSNFINAKNEFYECYKKISYVKLDNEANNNFFAPIHIYRGIPAESESQNHTIYIWSPGDSSLESFDDHLTQMQKRINKEIKLPSGNINCLLANELHTVLQAIKALAIGIQNLHYENLLHLDIKPSNFGLRNLGENNGDNISVSLFDINTIYSRSNPFARTAGTLYFRAPEMVDDIFNNYDNIQVGCLSDLYSLGATLYNSIIIAPNERGLYEVKKFSDIDTELSRSLLFEYSEYNSKAEIHDILANILKRSLARNARDYLQGVKNYIGVGEFIADINKADEMVKLQLGIAREEGTDKKATLQVVDKEEYYADKIDGGAVSAMQCLLYDNPLYDYVDDGKLNVLVLGSGVFGQRFIDIAFELSQIKDCYLNITVVSKEKEKDEDRYLKARPEFKSYFYINGEKPKYDAYGAYGSIKFVDVCSSYGDRFSIESEHNIDMLKDSLGSTDDKFGYVFIGLSDETLNKKLASDLAKSNNLLSSKAIVNFVSYKDLLKEEKIRKEKAKAKEEYWLFDASFDKLTELAALNNIKLNPVFVKNTLVNHKDYRFLTRMAFNGHLIWGDGLNVDINKSYGDFRSAYKYTASFANALSVGYKLHSIGLELKDITDEKDKSVREEKLRVLTQAYRKKIGIGGKKSSEQLQTLNELTMYEHRRWNVNMICSSSYTELPDAEYVNLKNSNKDNRNRKHSCIVPSTQEWTLNSSKWRELSKWDEENLEKTEDFKKLDPLDKMSVRLHRHFMSLARGFNMAAIENDAGIVRRYLSDKPEALAAFNAYLISMKAITARKSRNDTTQETYSHCAEAFGKHLKDSELSNADEIKKRVKSIENAFEPVKMAYDYTDYKSKDQKLIYNIPFILNYSTSIRLCIPFVKGNANNDWFENVASSIVINPSIVTYLIDIDDPKKIVSSVKDNLLNVTRVMDGHSLQTKISLVLYVKDKDGFIEEHKKAEVEKELKELSPRIYSVDIVEIKNQKDLVSRIKSTFETNQKSSSKFSAIEVNGEFISGSIYSIPNLTIPTYEFNSKEKSFHTEDNEESYIWFSDIRFNTHLHIEDMFLAQARLSVYQEPELHNDYMGIWENCYHDEKNQNEAIKTLGWKALCSAIKKNIEKNNILMNLPTWNNSRNKPINTSIFVPIFCRTAIENLFEFLSSPKIKLTENVQLSDYNSSMLKVSFNSTEETRKSILGIFKKVYLLTSASCLEFVYNGSYITVRFSSLIVENFAWSSLDDEIQNKRKAQEIINAAKEAFNYLVNNGYIIQFDDTENDLISFCFASSQIKELLTKEGQLLELYTYYKTVEHGYFDEVKTGLEVQRKRANSEYVSTQEFDLIAIKGFRTQLVEIKAERKLKQEFYQKLKANGDKFGINKELVLVSHFGDNNDVSPENKEFIERGQEDYGVKTICKVSKIENIGKTLSEIMKKKAND